MVLKFDILDLKDVVNRCAMDLLLSFKFFLKCYGLELRDKARLVVQQLITSNLYGGYRYALFKFGSKDAL